MTGTASPIVRAAPAVAAAAIALAVGAVAEYVAADGGVWETPMVAIDSAVGAATVAAGLTAWIARPDSRLGPLIVAMGGVWFLGAFGYASDQTLVDYVGSPLQGWQDVFLVLLLVGFSPGGLRGRAARAVAAGVVVSHVSLGLARLLLRPPNDVSSCFCVPNRITGVTDPSAYETAVRVASIAEAAFAFVALALVVSRMRLASGAHRRVLGAVLLAATVATVLITYNRVVTRVVSTPQETNRTMQGVLDLVRATVPLAIAASLVRGRRARTRVADLVVSLDGGGVGAPGTLERALADPSVRLLRWEPERSAYVNGDGGPATLPEPGGQLASTVLERDGTVLGALVHDAALLEEPELLDAVAAAARLALDNERLAAEARARLAEVQASRQRIVEAGEAERRRLERDLHDGAQQRLLALALGLRGLERRAASSGDLAIADGLDALAAELDAAMHEVRELARGIRPPALTEAGLATALEALAERTPLPVELDARIDRRLPDAVETTAYFAAGEALANVLRHAGASRARVSALDDGRRLTVTVSDDGRGGADAARGSGLAGLADRLDALGGALAVDSHPGEGTTVTATIPLSPPRSPAGT